MLYLYCIPDEPTIDLWESQSVPLFNVSSIVPIPELERKGFYVCRYMDSLPTNDPLDDLEVIKGLLHPKYGDKEYAVSLISKITLRELEKLGRGDLVKAIKALG